MLILSAGRLYFFKWISLSLFLSCALGVSIVAMAESSLDIPAVPSVGAGEFDDFSKSLEFKNGPVRLDYNADYLIDDFETGDTYKIRTRGRPNYEIEQRSGIASGGNSSLLIGINPSLEDGHHVLELEWKIDSGLDMSQYDGITFNHLCLDDDWRSYNIIAVEEGGALYKNYVQILPGHAGEWQTIHLDNKDWHWFHEGRADENNKLDLDKIKAIRFVLQTGKDQTFAFGLDSFGLHKNPPVYKGANLVVHNDTGSILPPDKNFDFKIEILNPLQENDLELSICSFDFNGTILFSDKMPISNNKLETKHFTIPGQKANHIYANIEIVKAGKPVFREQRQMANICPLSEADAAPNKNSIFGTWVGGGMKNLGVKWSRSYVRATNVTQKDGKLEFKHPISKKVMPGISQTMYFVYTPNWLNSKPGRNDWYKYKPNDWNAYGKYIEQVVAEAKKSGFTHYEVWNEPVPWAYWMGTIEDVAKLHEVTYKAIKKVQPDSVVLGPCPYSFLWSFLDEFFNFGGSQWIDDVVVHAYGSKSPDEELHPNLIKLRRFLDERGMSDKDIYITELGYSTPKVTEKQQAEYLVRSYIYAMKEGVKLVTWHSLWQYKQGDQPGFSILRYDKSPRPAYTAYAVLINMLENAKFVGEAKNLKDNQRGYVFTKNGKTISVLWYTGDAVSNYTVSSRNKTIRIFNIMGEEMTLHHAADKPTIVQLSTSPIYVINQSE